MTTLNPTKTEKSSAKTQPTKKTPVGLLILIGWTILFGFSYLMFLLYGFTPIIHASGAIKTLSLVALVFFIGIDMQPTHSTKKPDEERHPLTLKTRDISLVILGVFGLPIITGHILVKPWGPLQLVDAVIYDPYNTLQIQNVSSVSLYQMENDVWRPAELPTPEDLARAWHTPFWVNSDTYKVIYNAEGTLFKTFEMSGHTYRTSLTYNIGPELMHNLFNTADIKGLATPNMRYIVIEQAYKQAYNDALESFSSDNPKAFIDTVMTQTCVYARAEDANGACLLDMTAEITVPEILHTTVIQAKQTFSQTYP